MAARVLSFIMMVGGAILLLPAAGSVILGLIGFGKAGVTLGSIAAFLQSLIYGGATRGLFSILQSLAARMVVYPLATFVGSVLTAVGAWFW